MNVNWKKKIYKMIMNNNNNEKHACSYGNMENIKFISK